MVSTSESISSSSSSSDAAAESSNGSPSLSGSWRTVPHAGILPRSLARARCPPAATVAEVWAPAGGAVEDDEDDEDEAAAP